MVNNIPKLIFIIPYRDRENEKTHFSIYMKYILEDIPDSNYEIYYSHQIDNRPFNRGAVKNIGFLVMKEKYPNDYKSITFVFNDIDTMPTQKNMFNYITTKGKVKHFYGFAFALGGIFSILGEDFEKCNGFPNIYGWGIEDNEMQRRVEEKNMKIDRSQFHIINSKNIIQIYDSPNRIISNRTPGDYMKRKLVDNLNQIRDLKYNIELNNENTKNFNKTNEFMINITNFNTLNNPSNDRYYVQNIFEDSKLKSNALDKTEARHRWNMNKIFIKH